MRSKKAVSNGKNHYVSIKVLKLELGLGNFFKSNLFIIMLRIV